MKTELYRVVEVVKEFAMATENGILIFIGSKLIIYVKKVYGFCVKTISNDANAIGTHFLVSNGFLG